MEIYRQITANNIVLQEYPFIKELAMEAYLIENEEVLSLDKHNFANVTVLDAEIALKKGRASGDGRIDILANYGGEYLAIVELKNAPLDEQALAQLQDYLNQKEQILQMHNYWEPQDTPPKWIGILVGTAITTELQEKLAQGYAYNDIPIAALTIRRFRSAERKDIFVVTDTYFKFNYGNKDYSKFSFEGKEYNKGRLVNAVIQKYVALNPATTYGQLEKAFPARLQGNYGVFNTLEEATAIFNKSNHKRYYIKPQEVIDLADGVAIATCNQWNPHNIQAFIEQADKHGLMIELV